MQHPAQSRRDIAQAPNFDQERTTSCYRTVQRFYADRLQVDIRSAIAAERVVLDPHLTGNVAGMAHWSVMGPDHRVVRPLIRLQPGLSALVTAGVLTHEVFHLLSALHRLKLPAPWEEGAANVAQYLFLQHHGSVEARAMQLALLNDGDAVYGDGFRMARHAYKRCGGFGAFMDFLKSNVGQAKQLVAVPSRVR